MCGEEIVYRSDLIRSKRAILRLTIDEVSKASGISKATISSIERDACINPGINTLKRIGDVLGLTLTDITEIRKEEYVAA